MSCSGTKEAKGASSGAGGLAGFAGVAAGAAFASGVVAGEASALAAGVGSLTRLGPRWVRCADSNQPAVAACPALQAGGSPVVADRLVPVAGSLVAGRGCARPGRGGLGCGHPGCCGRRRPIPTADHPKGNGHRWGRLPRGTAGSARRRGRAAPGGVLRWWRLGLLLPEGPAHLARPRVTRARAAAGTQGKAGAARTQQATTAGGQQHPDTDRQRRAAPDEQTQAHQRARIERTHKHHGQQGSEERQEQQLAQQDWGLRRGPLVSLPPEAGPANAAAAPSRSPADQRCAPRENPPCRRWCVAGGTRPVRAERRGLQPPPGR